jgi:hypothetical protein
MLWKMRLTDWVKVFNDIAFRQALVLHNSDYCERLLYDFADYGQWNDHSKDFHLTDDNLRWMDWGGANYAYIRKRIAVGNFTSEEAYLRWQLQQEELVAPFDLNCGVPLADRSKIHQIIMRLTEIQVDTDEYRDLENNLLSRQLAELQNQLKKLSPNSWRIPYIMGRLKSTHLALV